MALHKQWAPALLLMFAISCGDNGSTTSSAQTLDLTEKSSGTTASITQGARIELTLQTIGPGGYDTPVVSPASVAKLVSFGEAPAGRQSPGGLTQLAIIEGVAHGTATLTSTRVSGTPSSSTSYSLTIDVE
jgi:hypothetical protein